MHSGMRCNMRSSYDFEKDFGVRWFISSAEGIGGKLRSIPEDFVVEEIGEPRPGEGCYALLLRHSNWESHSLRVKISRELGLRDGELTVAGTKDKRALVTQWMTMKRRTAPNLEISGVEVLETRACSSLLRSGEHEGNRFTIRIRDTNLEEAEALERAKEISCDGRGLWPNFFGIQRFGAFRPITHRVGEALVKKGAEEAVKMYLGSPGISTGEEKRARELVEQGAAWEDVLEAAPPQMGFERMMLSWLVDRGDDYEGALKRIPGSLLRLFVHSYQSFLFNQALSARIELEGDFAEPMEGDLLQPSSARLVGGSPRFVPVSKNNLPAISKAVAEDKGELTVFLPGSDNVLAKGVQGEIERNVLDAAGLQPEDFKIPGLPEASSKGTRRPILLKPKELEVVWDEGLVLSFMLGTGKYATTLLREIMKSPDPLVY